MVNLSLVFPASLSLAELEASCGTQLTPRVIALRPSESLTWESVNSEILSGVNL
jgi:hypothetical protein